MVSAASSGCAAAYLLQETMHGRTHDEGDWAYLLHVEVEGTRAGRAARRVYRTRHPSMREWGRSATARMTGIPASIAAQFIASGNVSGSGVLAPEAAFDPANFVAELARRGIYIEERIEEHALIANGPADILESEQTLAATSLE
jgi:saccharopine dehydrogenase-like NADP-dependent oxidoreductase